jgi:hypothetical protein
MPRLFQVTTFDREKTRKEWSDEFPGARFGTIWDICPEVMKSFCEALAEESEEAIQKVLTGNPYLIQYAIPHSGHHGIWAFPKPMIKPPTLNGSSGLIPDYLVVTKSSLGYFWYIVEIKRYDVQFASPDGRGYSRDGQRAIAQCNRYLVHFQDYIEAVRSNICIGDLIQPKGAVLLIGNSETESEAQQRCRANFVRTTPMIDVVSYQRIFGGARRKLPFCRGASV